MIQVILSVQLQGFYGDPTPQFDADTIQINDGILSVGSPKKLIAVFNKGEWLAVRDLDNEATMTSQRLSNLKAMKDEELLAMIRNHLTCIAGFNGKTLYQYAQEHKGSDTHKYIQPHQCRESLHDLLEESAKRGLT